MATSSSFGPFKEYFLGDAVVSLLKSVGHKVVRTQIINDRGIHICKSMVLGFS